MASLAGLLHLDGHRIAGVDQQLYPPMSTVLEELAVEVRLGFDPEQIPAWVDRVIIGNAVPRDNPEVVAVQERRLPYLSQAEAVSHYLLAAGREAIVVAGTHGKTTTTSLLAWLLEECGADPTYLVGGMLRWNRRSFRLGRGPWMVIEGDEYNTAFFDRGPKFLHYRPNIFVLGPVEHDHADLYRDLDAVLTAFRAGTAQVPRHGRVIVDAGSEAALAACRDATAPLVTVGTDEQCDLQIVPMSSDPQGSRAAVRWQGSSAQLHLPLHGRHNLSNAAMALAAALVAGQSLADGVQALSRFPGVARRMQVVGEAAGVTVVDDFAHHPTALAATIAAARERWPQRRLVLAYEPRSLTAARAMLQDSYKQALAGADVALMAAPFHRGRLRPEEMIDRNALAEALQRCGVEPLMPPPEDDPVAVLQQVLAAGDVVIGCSSGDFGRFQQRLLEALGGSDDV